VCGARSAHAKETTKASLLMNHLTTARVTRGALVLALALALSVALVGCNKTDKKAGSGGTAMDNIEVAKSSLSTTAPDAKLLLVQTANVVTATSTPVWQYLFGSPKDGSIVAVTVEKGKVTATQPYGSAGMDAAEWKLIPDSAEWKIDSDEAFAAALKIDKKATDKTPWAMGFVTYIPKSAASSTTIDPFVWSVALDPQGTAPSTVDVDAKTGKATAAPAK